MSRIDGPRPRLTNVELAERLRAVRRELFGKHGGPELALRLGLPSQTWSNYESGVTIPGVVILGFIEITRVEPGWLLTGQGPRYRCPAGGQERGLVS